MKSWHSIQDSIESRLVFYTLTLFYTPAPSLEVVQVVQKDHLESLKFRNVEGNY